MTTIFEAAGLDEIITLFGQIAPRECANSIRVMLYDIAKQAAQHVKQLEMRHYKTGNLNSQIKPTRLRSRFDKPMTAVKMTKKIPGYVSRRRNRNPAQRHARMGRRLSAVSSHAQRHPKPAYYWKFLEKGTRFIQGDNVLEPYQQQLNAQLPSIMRESWGRKFEERLARFNRRNANS